MSATRIVVADDHALFREALGELLNAQPSMTVVGYACDGAEAVRCAAAHQPDLLLLDLQMPSNHGPGTVRGVLRVAPRTRVLFLSAYAEPHAVDQLLAAGARGVLHKGIDRKALLVALSRAMADDHQTTVLVPSTAAPATGDEPLSRREHQVLARAATAMSNRQIADALDITEGTVKRHLHSVFRKLGAVSRLDAVNKAVQASLIPSPAMPSARQRPSARELIHGPTAAVGTGVGSSGG
ncbi:response regulator transcription factor [Streptomyces sp. NPDC051993]|uniref:response regulator transcription factor n=1 Tax=unclassified Streptomyces TaxID=2593676 RepID=UPI00341547AA